MAKQGKSSNWSSDQLPDSSGSRTRITATLQVELKEAGGFEVDAFTDPLLALKSFKPNLYDLVLIDIVMPQIDGFKLYERLNKIDIKTCFLTASEVYHEEFRVEENVVQIKIYCFKS